VFFSLFFSPKWGPGHEPLIAPSLGTSLYVYIRNFFLRIYAELIELILWELCLLENKHPTSNIAWVITNVNIMKMLYGSKTQLFALHILTDTFLSVNILYTAICLLFLLVIEMKAYEIGGFINKQKCTVQKCPENKINPLFTTHDIAMILYLNILYIQVYILYVCAFSRWCIYFPF